MYIYILFFSFIPESNGFQWNIHPWAPESNCEKDFPLETQRK